MGNKPRVLWIDKQSAAFLEIKDKTQCHYILAALDPKDKTENYTERYIEYRAFEKAIEALKDIKKKLEWYRDTFNGWETSEHEFEHFWRVELSDQIEKTLEELGEVEG